MATTNDPLASKQWHLSAIGVDKLNGEFKGAGVSTGIFDDGVDLNHEDLKNNYDASKEFTVGGVKQAPNVGSAVHGTAVAGIIAAQADNGIGGGGVSSSAKITGIDIFGNAGGSNMIAALATMKNFDTVNHSWGWTDAFADRASTSFGSAFLNTLKTAVETGRGGLGTVIVQSAGNEWNDDMRSANTSEFGASRYSITVGAIGQNGDVAYYSNRGSNLLVSAPSNGGGSGITTTDQTGSAGYNAGNYTDTFGGTSAAAPIVTGVVNLMMDASGKVLGWRDVQEILAITADHTTPTSLTGTATGQMVYGWQINGANNVDGGGMHYSNDVGYGMVDAFEAVRMAEVWSNFGPMETSANEVKVSTSAAINKAIADKATTTFTVNVAQSVSVEHVDLTLNLTHGNIKQLQVELVSAEGTKSILLSPMTGTGMAASGAYTFGSDALHGELSNGTWTVRVTDTVTGVVGTIVDYKLDIYGSAVTADDVYHYTDEFVSKMLGLSASRGVLNDVNGGNDWINMAALTGNVTADLANGGSISIDGTKRISISGQIENIVTGDGADRIVGNDLANKLMGMRGNDVLEGKGGADTIDGGQGIDTASYATSNAGVVVDLKAAFQIGGHAQGDKLISIENVVGSAYADRIDGDAGANVITGGGGNDRIDGGAGDDTAVFSGKLSDYTVLRGTDASGSYVQLTHKSGGIDGVDTVYNVEKFSFSDQTVAGTALQTTPVAPTTPTPPVVVPPTSNVGTTFNATNGNDVFNGTAKNDVFKLGTLLAGSDKFDGGAGIDTLDLSGVAAGARVWVQLNSGDSFSVGNSYGTAKNIENIVGSVNNDTIYGNNLDNRIDGGKGNDILRGYGGKDTFVFTGASGSDAIYDFTKGEDKLDFGAGMDRAHLTVKVSGSDLIVSDADSFVTLIGGSKLALTNDDFVY